MHPFPKDAEFSFLVTKVLLQVCIGHNEIVLHFEDNDFDKVSVTIESSVGVINQRTEGEEIFDIMPTTTPAIEIAKFIGCSIEGICFNEDGTLILNFTNGGVIILYNSKQDYVSYSVFHNDKEAILV